MRAPAWTIIGLLAIVAVAGAALVAGVDGESTSGNGSPGSGAAITTRPRSSTPTTAAPMSPGPTTATTSLPAPAVVAATPEAPSDPEPALVTAPNGYTYLPKPDFAPGVVGPGGALTKHLVADIAAAFGFEPAEVEAAIASAELPPEAEGNPEGWLAPGAYPQPETAEGLIAAMIDRRVHQLEARGVPREQWHRVLTAASVIEKETYNQTEKPKVARVLHNRLDGGGPLQMDSIILYPLPEDRIFTTAQERASNQPYNSYRHAGLPPTPISAPDEESIDAFLNPPEGDWFFYVTIDLDTGETRYAVAYDDHLANVELLRAWLAEHPTP